MRSPGGIRVDPEAGEATPLRGGRGAGGEHCGAPVFLRDFRAAERFKLKITVPPAMLRVLLLIGSVLLPAAVLSAGEPLRAVIDREIAAGWAKHGITPAPPSGDAGFLRRVTLDLVGTVPTADEAAAFLADRDPDKRSKAIDRLLADRRFAAAQADVWDVVLFGRRPGNASDTRSRPAFKAWLTRQFAEGTPYDRMVRELILAEQPGSEMFLVQFRNAPEEAAVHVSRIFLGMQLQCARCHDHPYDVWSQRDFYGVAGFFVRLVVQETGSGKSRMFSIGEKSTGDVLFSGAAKDQAPGRKGEPVKPRFLGGAELAEPPLPKDFREPTVRKDARLPPPVFSRKRRFAEWLGSADNPYLARAAVNRVWAQFMGRGLVHPVDDLREDNPASHPELLAAMAEDFRASGFDLKRLVREIVNSKAYQLAGMGPPADALPPHFQRARVRPLSAEEMVAAMRTATGHHDPKAAEGGVGEYFLRYYGEPTNGLGDFQGSLGEHLFANNGEHVRRFVRRGKGNLADRLLTSDEPWERRVDRMFLAVLGRPPDPQERDRFAAYIRDDPKPEARLEDAIWVLLNGSEFRFNH